MFKHLHRLVHEDDGMEFVEYGLIVAVMVMVAFGAWSSLGDGIRDTIQGVADELN